MDGKKIDDWSGERTLFFSYGQDMNPDMMANRGAELISVARLAGFKLDFSGHSTYWGGGEENALPSPHSDLWGAVYALSFKDAEALDGRQGARLDGTGPYYHYPVLVHDASGGAYHALMYRKSRNDTPRPPSRAQLDCVIAGARARGLPENYVARLAARPIDPEALATQKTSAANPSFTCDCGSARA
jgi:hypothetical protein